MKVGVHEERVQVKIARARINRLTRDSADSVELWSRTIEFALFHKM